MSNTSRWAGIGAIGLTAIALAGCGTQQVSAASYVAAQPQAKTVTFKVDSNTGLPKSTTTIDGVQTGHLTFTIPKGYRVTMDFINQGAFPESFGVYNGHRLAFPNSGESYYATRDSATGGLLPGQTQTFTFTANRTGTYSLSDVLWGDPHDQPISNIFDTVKVVNRGTPTISRSS